MESMMTEYTRKKRREGIGLTIISLLFVALGLFSFFVVGNHLLAMIVIPFFGTALMVGMFQTVRPGQDLPPALGTICCFGMALSGVVLFLSDLLRANALGWRQGVALPVGILATAFFGGGGIYLVSSARCVGVARRHTGDQHPNRRKVRRLLREWDHDNVYRLGQ
jgi:hypothetical protein